MQTKTYTISVTWGRSCTYHPFSTPQMCWDGKLDVQNGTVNYLDKLTYKFVAWSQAHEISANIYNTKWQGGLRNVGTNLAWKSDVTPGDPGSLEGLRFEIQGDENTVITLDMVPVKIQFKLGQLIDREQLCYLIGQKYAANEVKIFLGKDARPRISRKGFLKQLSGAPGYLIMPDDFCNAPKTYHLSTYGAELAAGQSISAHFPIADFRSGLTGNCLLHIQAAPMLGYSVLNAEENIRFCVKIGNFRQEVSRLFANRAFMPNMEDIYIEIPWGVLSAENEIVLTHLDGNASLLIHRVFVNTKKASLEDRLSKLPQLPKKRNFHVGFETDMLVPANGDMDALIENMHTEELGDYIQFRERAASASDEDIIRWGKKVREYGFVSTISGCTRPEALAVFEQEMGDDCLGPISHEISNLAYGWGEADPIEIRKDRTLPECKASYLARMNAKMVGQAIAQQHLDYEAGVETVITEIPGSHCTLTLSGARGAAKAHQKDVWGVHVANHVQKIPLDMHTVRRLFTVVAESWLFGATFLNDEEVALRYNHDTAYAYSDKLPTAYREIYQALYHYGNRISLGRPVVKTGFLHGNYDFLVGGTMAGPYIHRPKFWGEFGPETEGWDLDTPEGGWKLIDSYLPGAHLCPIPQNADDIRIFYSGTPYGQVDLVPITSGVENLSQYELLYLPGWNTMTPALYEDLIAYVQQGGHLVLCAAQCTEHITRKFLLDKKDFRFINSGDLSALAGVKVSVPDGIINTVHFADEDVYTNPGVPGLQTELCGGKAIAVDQDGNPVVVENRIGSGKVWMLTVGEYWGHDHLDALRRAICRKAAMEHPNGVSVVGSDEVEYHLFDCDSYQRVVLLNTDWTCAGNIKQVVLHSGAVHMPLSVTEGKMKQILLTKEFAVGFDVPGAIVDNLTVTQESASFTLEGFDTVAINLCSLRTIGEVSIKGAEYTYDGNVLSVRLGESWSSCKITLRFA